MKFFCDCKDIDEAKAIYHKLAKVMHPDKGGSQELMVELQKQYDDMKKNGIFGVNRSKRPFKPYAMHPFASFDDDLHTEIDSLRKLIDNKDLIIGILSSDCSRVKFENNSLKDKLNNFNRRIEYLNKNNDELNALIETFPNTIWGFIKWRYRNK